MLWPTFERVEAGHVRTSQRFVTISLLSETAQHRPVNVSPESSCKFGPSQNGSAAGCRLNADFMSAEFSNLRSTGPQAIYYNFNARTCMRQGCSVASWIPGTDSIPSLAARLKSSLQ